MTVYNNRSGVPGGTHDRSKGTMEQVPGQMVLPLEWPMPSKEKSAQYMREALREKDDDNRREWYE